MLAASRALEHYEAQTELARIQHERSKLQVLLSTSQRTTDAELEAYYALTGRLLGISIDAQAMIQAQLQRRKRRWEELTGWKLGSQELEAAIDATIAHM